MRILLTADPILTVPLVGYGGIERIVGSLVGERRAEPCQPRRQGGSAGFLDAFTPGL